MQIILLTHEREVDRVTNTGQLALNLLPQYCRRIVWSRVNAASELVEQLNNGTAKLLFPQESFSGEVTHNIENIDDKVCDVDSLKAIVILDATWQEARKMFRQSPYLKTANRLSMPATKSSQYNLRRNQLPEGLCTAECIIALLEKAGMLQEADRLNRKFVEHCNISSASR